MNTALLIIQSILAILFTLAGIMKITQPVNKLANQMSWVSRFPATTVRLIGLSELLGAIGIILPWFLNVTPVLAPIAALGLAVIQILAIGHHIKYKEYKFIIFNLVLLMMALFVAYGRF